MTSKVSIVDFGAGNMLSVERALRRCGAEISLAGTPQSVIAADRIVLPGVGAFANCMGALRSRDLIEPLMRFADSGRPFLGICVGMQMLFEASEEFGDHQGLGLIPGRVMRITDIASGGSRLKVPHVGWSELEEPRNGAWCGGILRSLKPATAVYFVHSFHGIPADPGHRLADCRYGGHRLLAAARRGNLFGCQFHPEKSGAAGLRIISEFMAL